MIIAPHPDDAELAAYGLYRQHAERAWILTLTAGEYQKRLDRQYLPFLDPDLKSASRRKGWIRAWNSATTPMLAGLSPERLYMLGYFNDTLGALLETPTIPQPSLGDETLSPADFRGWNPGPLASDERANGPENRGSDLLADLERLLDEIRPSTVVTPHPELDPHPTIERPPRPWRWPCGAPGTGHNACCCMPTTSGASGASREGRPMPPPASGRYSMPSLDWALGRSTVSHSIWKPNARRPWPWTACTTSGTNRVGASPETRHEAPTERAFSP